MKLLFLFSAVLICVIVFVLNQQCEVNACQNWLVVSPKATDFDSDNDNNANTDTVTLGDDHIRIGVVTSVSVVVLVRIKDGGFWSDN